MTLWAPLLVVAYGAVMPFLLLYFYVRPYQRGTGELAADGGINWLTGEAILPLTWALVYVPLGIVVYRVIRQGYGPGASARGQRGRQENPAPRAPGPSGASRRG